MKLFEYEDRAVCVLDVNTALVFDGSHWRPASVYTARSALVNGTPLAPQEFREQFPFAAAMLSKVDIQNCGSKPS